MEVHAVIPTKLPCGTNRGSIFENVVKLEQKYHSTLCVKEIPQMQDPSGWIMVVLKIAILDKLPLWQQKWQHNTQNLTIPWPCQTTYCISNLSTICPVVLSVTCLRDKNWCRPNWQSRTKPLGDDLPEQLSHRCTDSMPCMKSITQKMYKLLTKQMSAAADNKPNTIPRPQPLAAGWANKHTASNKINKINKHTTSSLWLATKINTV